MARQWRRSGGNSGAVAAVVARWLAAMAARWRLWWRGGVSGGAVAAMAARRAA